jgi:hypothetical protein
MLYLIKSKVHEPDPVKERFFPIERYKLHSRIDCSYDPSKTKFLRDAM